MASLQDPEETDITEQDTDSLLPKKVFIYPADTAKMLQPGAITCIM